MSPAVSPIEKSLLRGKWTAQREDDSHPIAPLARAVVEGRFWEALTSPAAQRLFRVPSAKFDQSFDQAFTLDVPATAADEAELLRLTLAVACLHAFVQVNWTGPDLDVQPLEVISLESEHPISLSEADINQKAISELAYGGEPAYHLTKVAAFLRLAQILLAAPYNHCQSASWWRLRTAFVHQQVLDEPVPLPSAILTSLESLTASFPSEPDLAGRLILEKGLLEHQFSHDKSAAELFVEAAKATGLEYELTGALGKRTKFQQFELSQLVLLAESHLADDDHNEPDLNGEPSTKITDETAKAPDESEARPNIPETLALNDDTLLEQTEFTSSNPSAPGSRLGHIDPSAQPPLHPLDQCILLSMCLNVKNTSPSHGLTNEQMSPYVARVISHPRNWSIHTMALLLRSRLESARTRTVERSTLQLQALIDQMPTADSALPERLLYFHSIPLPSKWELERELAMRFLSLGVVKSALEIFERLEMWEEVVKCWGALERPEKAIAIVRDLLEGRKAEAEEVLSRGKKTPADTSRRQVHDKAREAKLWCLLGDLEPKSAVAHYERAWTVSGGSSGRAMRSLGGYHFARGAYAEAIVCLKRAVAINPLLARSWFILGCACMRVEAWEEAKGAFSRCVAIDEDDGESWNNLASMYLRIGTSTSTAAEKEKKGSEGEEESAVGDGEAQTSPATQITTSKSIPFANKLLAFRALKQGLRFSYDNWRMWYNYMIVAMDVGELAEAARALGRVVEETSDKTGADAVDEDVLERLVDAVTRAHVDPTTEVGAGAGGGDLAAANPNEGHGLLRSVKDLFDRIILPRVSSPRIFRAYARLLTWEGRWGDALKAHMDAYRSGVAGTMERGETDVEKWREAVGEVEEIVDVLINFGPRVEDVEGQEGTGKKWKLQARSIVRTFMGRTRENFEDEPEWGRLERLLEEVA
ncbi:TPR repeat-containing protein C19B12.01 [Hypsizygus marmoreus]|uniref:TPR repeat-containing protein C19B12.01 n=1 Tax=Hypsizygus marmoreus TaxID=39966 RepID=A0A369JCF4_HYPMA|nr:TPR repeat-containing protein C19B12.01 [Hypsizygus marmoreus]